MNRSKRERRYQRRKQAQDEKRQSKLAEYDNFDNAINIPTLISAAQKAQRGVKWKASVQSYMANLCYHSAKTYNDIISGKDIRKGFYEFNINERGKERHIQSLRYSERVVHKAYTDNALYPIMTNGLIYDNYASQKGKGTDFALQRMKQFLQEHYRKHGREGGILLIDLSSYFESIDHEVLYKIYEHDFTDPRLIQMGKLFIDAYDKGLGLGSETCQISAIRYSSHIDHLIKDKMGIKHYGRYMDDSFIIHEDKQYLEQLLYLLEEEYGKIGITLNRRKTKICDLKHGFTWLKHRYYLTETGKVIIKPCRKSITKERRKLKKQGKFLQEKTMTVDDIKTSYYSWRGYMLKKNTYRTVLNMDELYRQITKGWDYIWEQTNRKKKNIV